jgi:hypothetical protein
MAVKSHSKGAVLGQRAAVAVPPFLQGIMHNAARPLQYIIQRISLFIEAHSRVSWYDTGGRRRAREKYREGQRGDFHSAKDPRNGNGFEIF